MHSVKKTTEAWSRTVGWPGFLGRSGAAESHVNQIWNDIASDFGVWLPNTVSSVRVCQQSDDGKTHCATPFDRAGMIAATVLSGCYWSCWDVETFPWPCSISSDSDNDRDSISICQHVKVPLLDKHDSQVIPTRSHAEQLVSVLSMAARYPSAAGTPSVRVGDARFWDAMSTGTDLVSRVPLQRWDVDNFYSPDLASKKMCAFTYYCLLRS